MTITIGITGPIGCGKSTVAGWLGELGALVIEADAVARAVTDSDPSVLADIVETFGPRVTRSDGARMTSRCHPMPLAKRRAPSTI